MQLCSAVCGKVLKTSGNTTNLKIHLKQKHSVVLQHLTEEEKEVGEPKKRKGPSHPESQMDFETARTSSAVPQSGKLKRGLVLLKNPAVSTILDPRFKQIHFRDPVSTILDPRFKQIHFRDPQAMGTVIRHIKSEIATLQNTSSSSESSDSSAEDPEFDLWAHHKKLAHTKKSGQGKSNKDSELNQYLSVPGRNLKDDLLDTWNEMKVVYPNLFKLAAKYSCVLATSVPSERIFSKAGATATKSRNRLTRSRLSKLLFLSSLPDSLHL
ncbi:hAT family C-terminal dimerization region [Popillia japonica]|uniref:HAT family C-terminal dimerization region n=1 Tax=Popillia japonica TaxID=7064 RepID=A0AAW1ISI9_POPJA